MPAITRRHAVAALGAAALSCSKREPRRPNILFVMSDDHHYQQLSCAGNPVLRTPNLDRLAKEGVRFENAFVTNSLCAPGRATVLTGAFSHINGIRGNSEAKDAIERMTPGIATFPKLLQQSGYRTGIAGKWHLSDTPEGFDNWRVLPGQGLYFDPEFIDNGTRKTYKGYATDITTDFALEFLSGESSRPWCLVYQHKAPHRPFLPAPRHARLFDDIELPYPATFNDDYSTRRVAREAEDMRFDISLAGDYKKEMPAGLSAAERKKWIYQRFVKDHYRAVVGVDENLGRVLKFLDDKGMAEDTLVIYTSDNGFFLGEYGWYDKRFMYEPSLRVPLLLRYPRKVAAGAVLPQMTMNVDIAATILDFAGIQAPSTVQGASWRPLLEGGDAASWRKSVYYSYYENSWALHGKGKEAMADPSFQFFTPHRIGPHRGVRTETHKLIHYYSEGDYWELFDLREDPNELNNLHGKPGTEKLTAGLREEMERLRKRYRDA